MTVLICVLLSTCQNLAELSNFYENRISSLSNCLNIGSLQAIKTSTKIRHTWIELSNFLKKSLFLSNIAKLCSQLFKDVIKKQYIKFRKFAVKKIQFSWPKHKVRLMFLVSKKNKETMNRLGKQHTGLRELSSLGYSLAVNTSKHL